MRADRQVAARILLTAWDDAVRVSTAVERWHSILRTHLSVHRTLSPGRLAVLVVWHNHRVFTRGVLLSLYVVGSRGYGVAIVNLKYSES